MLDHEEFARRRATADEALRSACAQRDAGFPQYACFMAEQAAQAALKAVLRGLAAEVRGHDLVALADAVTDQTAAPAPDDVTAGLQSLSRHYIASRYPDAYTAGTPASHYGPRDAETALADAERVIAHVDRIWVTVRGEADEPPA